jgi:hypothetical protein
MLQKLIYYIFIFPSSKFYNFYGFLIFKIIFGRTCYGFTVISWLFPSSGITLQSGIGGGLTTSSRPSMHLITLTFSLNWVVKGFWGLGKVSNRSGKLV